MMMLKIAWKMASLINSTNIHGAYTVSQARYLTQDTMVSKTVELTFIQLVF